MKIKGVKSLCSLTQKLEITGLHVVAFYDPKKKHGFWENFKQRILYIKGL